MEWHLFEGKKKTVKIRRQSRSMTLLYLEVITSDKILRYVSLGRMCCSSVLIVDILKINGLKFYDRSLRLAMLMEQIVMIQIM